MGGPQCDVLRTARQNILNLNLGRTRHLMLNVYVRDRYLYSSLGRPLLMTHMEH